LAKHLEGRSVVVDDDGDDDRDGDGIDVDIDRGQTNLPLRGI